MHRELRITTQLWVNADRCAHYSLESISDGLLVLPHYFTFSSKHMLTHTIFLFVCFIILPLSFHRLHWVPLCGAAQVISLIVFFIRELQLENTVACWMNPSQLSVLKLAHSAALRKAPAAGCCPANWLIRLEDAGCLLQPISDYRRPWWTECP